MIKQRLLIGDSSVLEHRASDQKITEPSILELTMRRYVLGSDTLRLLGPSSLPVVVAQPDERLANKTSK